MIDTDYLVIGAGACALAFVDTLLSESEGTRVTLVDRRAKPGGHWNDAYPFVRVHQPSAFYGVNSMELATGRLDTTGLNAGLHTLATGIEVLAYFERLMQDRFLPSGRVRYLPMHEVVGGNEVVSLLSGTRESVTVRRRVVDATYADTATPATHPPRYAVDAAVRCIPLGELPRLTEPAPAYVVVGSGKTGIDACLWLLEHGAKPEALHWVVPNDAWLLDRALMQPGIDFFMGTFGSVARQLEAVAAASGWRDLFERLEAGGDLLRLDPNVWPTAYRCATVSRAELVELRRIPNVIRKGRLRAVTPASLVLDRGEAPLPQGALIVDCSASAIPQRGPQPIWVGQRLLIQMVRRCQPTFSAALLAHVECRLEDEAAKNALCAPVPPPLVPEDWLRMMAADLRNTAAWSKDEVLGEWLARVRLNSFFDSPRRVAPDDAEKQALLARYRAAVRPAAANLQRLLVSVA